MRSRIILRQSPRRVLGRAPHLAAIAIAVASLVPGVTLAQTAYPSPAAAAEAFTAALENRNPEMMREVLGDDFLRFIPEETYKEEIIQQYLESWKKRHAIVPNQESEVEGAMAVSVGQGDWTLPIPLVESEAGWRFDTVEGAELMKTRRVGRNELAVIQASLAYCDAQREYAARDRTGNGFTEYARRIISTPGEMDGLYWARLEDEDEESPLGPFFGDDEVGSTYHGYQFRILESQGGNARGGAKDFVVDGAMTEGFALVAWPAKYDDSGVMTFFVNQDEIVYQADLGPDSDALARAMTAFDPDPERWKPAESGS
jgi:hypothetical protein